MSISVLTLKPSQFVSPHKTKLISNPTLKSSQFGPPTQKACQFACSDKKQVFRPSFKHKLNFDHPHNQMNFIPRLKSSQIRSPKLKSSQFGPPTQEPNQFHPYTEIISILSPTPRSSQFRPSQIPSQFPCSHEEQTIFDPHTKTRSRLNPARKTCQFR